MSDSRFCPRCLQPVPDQTPDGVCPSCGSVIRHTAETPRAQDTPPLREDEFAVGSDPNVTGTHVASTIRQETPLKRPAFVVPQIPNYTDFELLGQGGMGIVFRAVQRPTDRPVAVKVMLSFSADGPMRERFINEVRALAKIKHAGIVPIYEVGECSLGPYFTMELITGSTLTDRMRKGRVTAKEAARIIASAAESVHAAHLEGIIHRDIKPSNILLDRDGNVKVNDFGLAKHVGGDDLTEKGVVVGTPSYMSPEQADADPEKVTKLADVYGLGSTLFHLATGQAPHRRATPMATLRQKAIDPTPLPRKVSPDLCPVLEAIILKSMARDPAERYETAAAFAQDLRWWEHGEPTLARPLTRGQKVKRFVGRHRVAVAVALLLPFLAAAAAFAKRESDPKRQIERSLARGEKVTLVGPTGFPRWHEWKHGSAELQRSVIEDGSPGFEIITGGMLTLVEDPIVENYRFSVELRHATYDQSLLRYTGIFFGYEPLPTDNGVPVFRHVLADYSDEYPPLPRVDPKTEPKVAARNERIKENHGLDIEESVMVHSPDGVKFLGGVHKRHPFTPVGAPAAHNIWRTLAVEARPGGFSVYFGPSADGPPPRVAQLGAEEIEDRVMGMNQTLKGTRILGFRWNPRRPLGIVASHSSIAFRNATIEPLPPSP